MADKKKYRRSNGEGSAFKHQNGRWCGQIGLGVDENGKRLRETVFEATRAEVVEQLKVLQGRVNAKKLKSSVRTTLGQFIEKWLIDFKTPHGVTEDIRVVFKHYKSLYKEVKDTALQKVNTYQVQQMFNMMKNEGLPVRSIKTAYNLLNQVYKAAIEFNMVGENPMAKVKISRKDKAKKAKALPIEVRKAVLGAIEDSETYKPIIYTTMGMGMRIGEVIALKWDDIDMSKGTISINKAAKSTPELSQDGKVTGRSMQISGTKTVCSVRTLPMPQVVKDVLKEWKKLYIQRFKASDVDNLVFPNKDGKLRSYSGFRRQFARYLGEKGVYEVSFHQFRHTFATMMLERGVNPRVVQEFLGRKDVSTTLGIYTGVTSAVMKEAARGADEAMRRLV